MLVSLLAALYVGAAGNLTLPQGGGDMCRLGGGVLRVGIQGTGETPAPPLSIPAPPLDLECELGWQENKALLGAQALWHWWDYERLVPFFSFGARGWVGKGRGEVGPCGGIGAFYYLDDHWALRADGSATLGLAREVEMVYQLGMGVQYEF